jgi:hypothetical protein
VAAVNDLLLRKSPESRAGAEPANNYGVISADTIGRIFRASTVPAGTPWMWTLAYGHEDRSPTTGYEATREAAMHAFGKSWHRGVIAKLEGL